MAAPESKIDQPWRTFLIFALLGPVLGGAMPFALMLARFAELLSDTPLEPMDRIWSGLSSAWLGLLFSGVPAIVTGLGALTLKRQGSGRIAYVGLCSLFGAALSGLLAVIMGGGGIFLWTMTATGAGAALICALLTWRTQPLPSIN